MKPVVFLGGGRITSALLAGLRLANYQAPIVVHDRNPAKLRALKKQFKIIPAPDLAAAVAQARLLIIAVRPDSVLSLLSEIRDLSVAERQQMLDKARPIHTSNQPQHIGCSLAAGIPLGRLRSTLPSYRWTRAMPSPVSRFGSGLTALSFDRSFPGPARKTVNEFFARVGKVLEIPERQFDAFTVTYSSSHGYHALAALARAAQQAGLDSRTALTAAAHALADGILAWREGHLSLEELLEEAATPGGIAAAVMRTMDAGGYSKLVSGGLRAGLIRTRKNAKLKS